MEQATRLDERAAIAKFNRDPFKLCNGCDSIRIAFVDVFGAGYCADCRDDEIGERGFDAFYAVAKTRGRR